MNIKEKVDGIVKVVAQLMDQCWCFAGTGQDIYIDALRKLGSTSGLVVATCCGRLPRNGHDAEILLQAGSQFFEISRKANLKEFSEFLDVRSCQLSLNEKSFRSRVQTSLAEIWNAKRCRQTHRRLTGAKEIAFAQDADALLAYGVALKSAARWLSARHQISVVSAMNRLKFTRNPSTRRERTPRQDEGWLSADYLACRKACVQELLQSTLAACPQDQVTEQALAEAVLVVATVCSRLSVWRAKQPLAWWFAFVEKVVAGKVALTRRERPCSTHKKHKDERL